ncbi:MAG: LOG family protein [Nanoarchaeota archaeon]|nr:LOG family protein [Nanoarchaeota archaeon]MBU1134983.1 LOG family protein [Nanoarchaeota archaeon]MBU2520088.1 LOG family protein [Nanoarchaeota archaeon]
MRIQIGVIGPEKSEYSDCPKKAIILENLAEKLGKLIAENKAVLITGGFDGTMEACSKGAKENNGLVVGTPGNVRGSGNRYLDVEIVTNIDKGSFISSGMLSSDAIIVIPGGAGTLAEFCMAYRFKKLLIVLKGLNEWYDKIIESGYIDDKKTARILGVDTPEEAINIALKTIQIEESVNNKGE